MFDRYVHYLNRPLLNPDPGQRYDPYEPCWYVQIMNRPTTCAKGGGSGGGSSSGKVDYPDYIKGMHGLFVTGNNQGFAVDGDTPTNSLIDALNAASGNSPFSGGAAYDPDTELAVLLTAICAYDTVVDALSYKTDWEAMVDAAVDKIDAKFLTSAYITAQVSAYSDNLDDRIENETLPRFKGGMRDINGVMTSAFVMGQSHIEGMADRDVALFQADLNLKMAAERASLIDSAVIKMSGMHGLRVEGEKSVAALTLEGNRLKIVSKAEQAKEDLAIDEKDSRWDLDIFTYAGNMLASIAGGTAVPGDTDAGKPSAMQGALGGAAAGAMIGTEISPGWGTAIGAVVGGIGGFLMS